MTVRDIYRKALALLLLREADARDMEEHVPELVNVMIAELRQADESITGLDRGLLQVSGMGDDVSLDPEIAIGVLPYGLAARLETDEDRSKAGWLLAEYMEKLRAVRRVLAGTVQDEY